MEADGHVLQELSQQQGLASDAQSLLAYYTSKKQHVKLIHSRLPAFDAEIVDARFAGKHYEEEKAFMGNAELREKLRRGNSLLRIGEGEHERLVVARRGIAKFFDISRSHVDALADAGDGKVDGKQFTGSSRDLFSQIIEPALDAMIQGMSVQVYKTEKANGENCQVAFIQELDAWLVSSKNVAVVFKTVDQLTEYKDARYTYAKTMAKTWIRLISKITDLKAIKDVLKNYTAIGEYCGNDNYQHFVEYPEETILFYALVPKSVSEGIICLPPSVALKVFEKLQIPLVGHEVSPPCTTLKDFASAMKAAYYDTARKSLKEVGEGLVIYITEISEEQGKRTERVLSLCKVKSVEYRLFRRIRERLKGGAEGVANIRAGLQELITKCGTAPHGADYYEQVALKARAVLAHLGVDAKAACRRFKDLLHLSLSCLAEDRLPTADEQARFASSPAPDDDEDDADAHN